MLFFADVDFYSQDSQGREQTCELLKHILTCLYHCMLYDSEGLFQNEVFTMLLQPLVDQVKRFMCGTMCILLLFLLHIHRPYAI